MTKPRIVKLTPIALAVLTALPVMAQTDTDQSTTEQEAGAIEEVVVTGSQIKGAAINDEALADEYSLDTLPTLVYYRNRIPIVYDGTSRLPAERGSTGLGRARCGMGWGGTPGMGVTWRRGRKSEVSHVGQ